MPVQNTVGGEILVTDPALQPEDRAARTHGRVVGRFLCQALFGRPSFLLETGEGAGEPDDAHVNLSSIELDPTQQARYNSCFADLTAAAAPESPQRQVLGRDVAYIDSMAHWDARIREVASRLDAANRNAGLSQHNSRRLRRFEGEVARLELALRELRGAQDVARARVEAMYGIYPEDTIREMATAFATNPYLGRIPMLGQTEPAA